MATCDSCKRDVELKHYTRIIGNKEITIEPVCADCAEILFKQFAVQLMSDYN